MVELVLSTLDEELLPHCYVAMRVGESQKIGRLSAERMYKFPETTVDEHKYAMLDVFQRVGGCTVSIKAKDGEQDLQVTTKAGNLNLRVSKPSYKDKTGKKPHQALVEDAPTLKPKFEAAKSYLAKHDLEARLKDAMKAVINELPDDPVGFINNKLRETDDPSIIRVPPSDNLPPIAVQDTTRLETLQALEEALKDGSFEVATTEAVADARTDLRQDVRQALLDSSLDGSLPVALSAVARPFSGYYTNHFKGTKFVQSFASQLFKIPDLVDPPSTLLEEQAKEFRNQIQEFTKDLSEDDILQCKKVFSQCEKPPPRDGTIKFGQLSEALQKLGHTLSTAELDNLMNEVGVDENGPITFTEFLDIVVEKREDEANVQELIRSFKLFDRSGTGFVSCADLRSVMTGLGDAFSQDEVEHMIREAGSKSDGQINYVEFSRNMVATAP
jgi:calmodulin